MNSSATGGPLLPLAPTPPLQGDALDDALTALVIGITGLDGSLVRPRWQPDPPNQPPAAIDWCAIGITSITPDGNATIIHFGGRSVNDPNAFDQMQRHEELEVTASFYGPNGASNAGLLRDGLAIAQNREPLVARGMAYINTIGFMALPELVNQQWIRRQDVTLRFRRIVVRNYPVLNIRAADAAVRTDAHPNVTEEAHIYAEP